MNWNLASLPVLAALALLLTGCGKHGKPHPAASANLPKAPVRVQTVARQSQPVYEEVVGTVRARLHATLEAKVSGRIEQLPVVLGQRVKAGDLVARLDAVEIKARLDQARAALEQAERDWNRISSLFKSQAVTRSELDSSEARLQVTKAGVTEAEAMLRYLEVRAPFDGVVARKMADVGDLASPGKPLVEIQDPAALQIDADVPEQLAGQLQLGAPLTIRVDSVKTPFTGQIAEMAPSADPASRTVRIKVDIAPAPGLMPGQFARVLVPLGESHCLDVPASSVVQRGQLEIVFVVNDQQARLHLVKTGKRAGDHVEILSGLEAGDTVVVEGAPLLLDGQPVEVRP